MNMFILRIWNLEAKQSNLFLKCESSEAKLFPSKKIFSKLNEHFYFKSLENRNETNGITVESEANKSLCSPGPMDKARPDAAQGSVA